MEKGIDHAPHKDWGKVGSYLSTAMQAIAMELGGDELSARIREAAASDEVLPNPAALKLLEDLHPGSAEQVMDRAAEVQAQAHELELGELEA